MGIVESMPWSRKRGITISGHHHAGNEEDGAVLAELLDLDAQVLGGYLAEVTSRVAHLADDQSVRRIADLGCGTGNGSVALAQVFGEAEIVAVDQSGEFLARLQAKARDLGLGDRVRTVEGNLDEKWPALGTVDLVWMSMSLHHLADPDAALTRILAALRPAGLLAVAEMGAHLRFLPDDLGLGEPGLEARCQAALAALMAEALPDLGSDWGPRLVEGGILGRDQAGLRDRGRPAAA